MKSHNPNTGIPMSRATFSAAGWNRITLKYLCSVKELGKSKLQVILDEAKTMVVQKDKQNDADNSDESDGHADLHSDPEEF